MSKIKLLNSIENGYFENNQIDIADSLPTSGIYKVGDIIVKATQVAGTAIGWICVTAGEPGVWSEFGGMLTDDRELIINPDSITMTELAVDVKAKLGLIDTLKTSIRQIENNYATKKDLENIDLSLYATKEDLEEIDLSDYATIKDVGDLAYLNTDDKKDLVAAINETNVFAHQNIGDMENLQTENKGNLVEAINELFYAGNNVKQKLVDTLIAKGVDCSTSNSFDEIITRIENSIIAPPWANGVGLTCSAAEMTTGRRFLTSAVLDNYIYAIGGYTGAATNVNEMYDTITNTWTTKKALTISVYGGAAVACGGSIYHLGGYGYTTSHYVYNPTTNTWTVKTALPQAKQYSAAVEVNGKVYISQGNNTYNMVYDPSTNAWTQLTRNGTNGGNYVSSAYYNGKIYVMGGATTTTYAIAYDIANNSWSSIASIPSGFYRAGQHGMVYKDKIYFMGGTYNGATSNTILRYDPNNNSWEVLPVTLAVAVYGNCTEIVNGKMYSIGGYSTTYVKNNQILFF